MAVVNPDLLVLFKLDLHPRLVFGRLAAEENGTDFFFAQCHRLVARAQEIRSPWACLSTRAKDGCRAPSPPAP